MPLIEWTDAFSVHIQEIDAQHQRLVAMLNELHDALHAGHGKDVLGRILNGLIEYAGTHFATEERYFDQYGYPRALTHCREHRKFAEKVTAFRTEFQNGQVALSVEVMAFLKDWLANHVTGEDRSYGPFLNAKGVT